MKNWINFGKMSLVVMSLTFANQSCTNLDEEVFSSVSAESVLNSETDVIAALAGCYEQLYMFGDHNRMLAISEVSSDEAIIATRGSDWGDGGQWVRMHRHEYDAKEPSFNNAWKDLYTGVGRCNLIIEGLSSKPEYAKYTAETRALRALYYYWLMDLFGNVPLSTVVDASVLPSKNTRLEVATFIESELKAVLPDLSSDVAGHYARMHKYAAHALLAKLYLNGVQFFGAAKWQDCIDQCNLVAAGPFIIEPNYYTNFDGLNKVSKENIFVIPFDNVVNGANNTGFFLANMTLHYQSQKTFSLKEQPWNGYCTSTEFYNSYSDGDLRKDNFIVGPQFDVDGVTPLLDPEKDVADTIAQIDFTPELNELEPRCWRQAGARIGKYKFDAVNRNMNNDFPLLRFADILLAKAEALWYLNNASQEALDIVNLQIRARAGVAPFDVLTPEALLAERGREMFYEGVRRQDLIRFGKFEQKNTAWQTEGSGEFRRVFPIPQPQINANPNLKQNDGY